MSETTPPVRPRVERKALRILIADDNRDAADTMAALLELEGHETQVVYSGDHALERAYTQRPHCALLDLGMSGVTGHDVARHLRAQPWAQNLMLVAVTGFGQPQEVQAALDAGFDFHFTKPIDAVELTAVLLKAAAAAEQEK